MTWEYNDFSWRKLVSGLENDLLGAMRLKKATEKKKDTGFCGMQIDGVLQIKDSPWWCQD